MPYARFKEINDQLKAAKEFQEKHGWAPQFYQQPDVFVESWIDQLAQDERFASKIYAKAARLLNSRRGQTPHVAEEPAPDVPIVDAQGREVDRTYSAKQLKAWKEWDWQQKQAAIDERMAPLEKAAKTQQDREQLAALQQQSWTEATTKLSELRQDPVFKANEAKVKAALAAHEEWGDNIDRAYAYVLATELLPTASQSGEKRVMESLQQKANAGTVGPSGSSVATPKKFKSFAEAHAYYEAHPEEAAAMANR